MTAAIMTEKDIAAALLVLMVLAGGQPVYHEAYETALTMALPDDECLANFVKALRGCTSFCLHASDYLTQEAERMSQYLLERNHVVFEAMLTACGIESLDEI